MSDRGPQHRRKHEILAAAIPHVVAQASGILRGIEKRDTHTVLAQRVIILHWCLDGILRLRGGDQHTPPPARREAEYKEAFDIFIRKTRDELLDLLADLVQVPERDWPGVKSLVILLVSLDALNLECRRRAGHRGIRRQVEAIRAGQDPPGRLKGLLRTTRVFGHTLAKWGGLSADEKKLADVESQDNICLEVLTELVKRRETVSTDLTVEGDRIPGGPFAVLYPLRKPWWGPVAARLRTQDILESVRALHPEVDDSLERYPLEAKDRLRAYRQAFTQEAVPTEAPTEPSCDPWAATEAADWFQRLEAFVCTTWNPRTWRAAQARWEGKTEEEAARVARVSRRELDRRLAAIQAWVKMEIG
jgi:hypothetical protein